MAYLLITVGEEAGRRFDLALAPATVGRAVSSDIRILDPKVSRRQFLLRRENDAYKLIPFECLNGVYVNGRRIMESIALHDRDKIQIGDSILRFRDTDHRHQLSAGEPPRNDADHPPADDVTIASGSGR